MATITYKNLPDTSTPLNATNLNTMQEIVEEGTWTPVISALNETAPTITYTTQRGRYKKIGNIVFISFYIRAKITALNGTNNYAMITGIPYNATELGLGAQQIGIGELYSAIYDPYDVVFDMTTSAIRIQKNFGAEAGKWIVTPTNYMDIAGSGFYFTA